MKELEILSSQSQWIISDFVYYYIVTKNIKLSALKRYTFFFYPIKNILIIYFKKIKRMRKSKRENALSLEYN